MSAEPKRKTPNILLFFTDQQRPDSIGCYGQPLPTTPHLDAMAARGTRFTHAFTPNPLCGPARASLQTGRYPTATFNHINHTLLPPDTDTIAKHLAAAGYATGYIGKWHLASFGPRNGTDDVRTSPIPPGRRGGYRDFWLAADALEFTSHGYGGRLFDADNREVAFDESVHRVDFMAERLLGAIDLLAADPRPFFLTASFLEPHHQNDHDAYEPPQGLAERFKDAPIPGDLQALPGNWDRHYANYLGCVAALDVALGKVLARLDQLGIRDNTLVAFVSDHGCHFATRNGEYKRSCHDASIHIPLVLDGPGFSGGRSVDAMASLLDLPPTFLRTAGAAVPAHWHGSPLQEAGSPGWREEMLVQISESQIGRCLRTRRWTYSVRVPGRPWAETRQPAPPWGDTYTEDFLYDNDADPHQLNNLVRSPEHAPVRADLRQRLIAAIAASGEPAPSILPRPSDAPLD